MLPEMQTESQSSFHLFTTQAHFKKINNIVVQNQATSGTTTRRGNYDPNPPSQWMFAYHFGKPLSSRWWLKNLGLSLVAPLPQIVILDTTSSFLPKYYWYDTRLNKTEFMLSVAQKYNQHFNTSLTLNAQWDVIAQSEMTTGTQGGTASSARVQAKLKPRFFPSLSALWKEKNTLLELTWSASSKQKIQNTVIGRAPLGGASTVDYTFFMDGVSNFEPMRIKLDANYTFSNIWHGLAGLTYEDWSSLNSTTLQITNAQGVVTNSSQFEQIKGNQIISPAIGLEAFLMDSYFSLSYRFVPKVLEKNNVSSGNTFDKDKHIVGLGVKKQVNTFGQMVHWSLASQVHYITSENITKSSNQEDGTSGSKIGANGYQAGGYFTVLSLGFELPF